MHIDRVVDLADPDRRLAVDFEPRRPGTEAVARLAAGEQLAEVDILVELDSDRPLPRPYHRRGDRLRGKFDRNHVTDVARLAGFGHQTARRQVAHADQLLTRRR